MRFVVSWAALLMLAALEGAAAQVPYCSFPIGSNEFYQNGTKCEDETGYKRSPANVPTGDMLPKVCNSTACLDFFAEVSAFQPTDCIMDGLKLRAELLDVIPGVCAPYTRAPTPAPTPKSTEKKEDDGKDSTVTRVFKIIGYVIAGGIGLFVLFLAFGCTVILVDALVGCYREIKSWFACCCNGRSKHTATNQPVELPTESAVDQVVYVDIERLPATNTNTNTNKATKPDVESVTATQLTAPTAFTSNTVSVGTSSSASETAVQTLLDDAAIKNAIIHLQDIHVGDVINHGAYGQVLRGVFEGEPVAIKRLLPARRHDMKEIATFLEEAKIMTTLRHANIVRLIGVAYNTAGGLSLRDAMSDLSIVCELMEGGDLRSMLSHADSNNAPTGFHADNLPIAIDIATALTYMHSLKPSAIVHRDLKSKNVLLTRDLRAKLTDFGISRERADATMTAGVGSFLWMAPEIVFGRRYDEKADVFSFGVLLSELDTHKLPYSQAMEPGSDRKLTEMMIVKMVSEGTLTVSFSENADAEVVELARACVATSALLRPSAETVLRRLVEIGERLARSKAGAGVSMLEDTNAFSMTTTRRMY